MKSDLTIFHYHLFPGGVTSVVALSVRAILAHLEGIGRITLVCGSEHNLKTLRRHLDEEAPEARRRVVFDVIPDLFYLSRDLTPDRRDELPDLGQLKRILLERYGGSLWWVHNYHLGKNPLFTELLLEVAEESPDQRLLLHIHDFPECARYENLAFLNRFVTHPLYPTSANVRYAVINNRDRALLESAGVPSAQLFLLNNPVPTDSPPQAEPQAVRSRLERNFATRFPAYRPGAPLLFYPVRTIRRKNVFEAGLLAAVSPEPANLIVTLPGVSEHEAPYSSLVEESFTRGEIPGMWGIGTELSATELSFQTLAVSTNCVISSSVQEGFGYLFIDGRRWRKPVFARYLDILDGVADVIDGRSAYFYREVRVPADAPLRARLRDRYRAKAQAMEGLLPRAAVERLEEAVEAAFSEATLEFSYLDVEAQRRLVRDSADAGLRAEIAALNRGALDALSRLIANVPEKIDDRIQAHFSLEAFARDLGVLIESFDDPFPPTATNGTARDASAIGRRLLDGFATLEQLRLLYE